MIKSKYFILMLLLFMVAGCTVPSKNLVGLQEYTLDPQHINGTWINADGAVTLKVMDPEKGLVRMFILEDKEKPEIYNLKIMKGKAWLYFNLLPEKSQSENKYYWGRIKIEDNKIVAWHSSDNAVSKAIAAGTLAGTVEPPCLTDSAKNIIDVVETSEKAFFQWEDPMFLIKLAK